jgi:hypothetical protein
MSLKNIILGAVLAGSAMFAGEGCIADKLNEPVIDKNEPVVQRVKEDLSVHKWNSRPYYLERSGIEGIEAYNLGNKCHKNPEGKVWGLKNIPEHIKHIYWIDGDGFFDITDAFTSECIPRYAVLGITDVPLDYPDNTTVVLSPEELTEEEYKTGEKRVIVLPMKPYREQGEVLSKIKDPLYESGGSKSKKIEDIGEYLLKDKKNEEIFLESPDTRNIVLNNLHDYVQFWFVKKNATKEDYRGIRTVGAKVSAERILRFIENPVIKKAAEMDRYNLNKVREVVTPYLNEGD